jgi:hypothetical protein
MISLPMISDSKSRIDLRTAGEHHGALLEESAGQIVLETADATVRVVHARAGGALHQVLDHLALTERVEDRRHGPQFQRIDPLNMR